MTQYFFQNLKSRALHVAEDMQVPRFKRYKDCSFQQLTYCELQWKPRQTNKNGILCIEFSWYTHTSINKVCKTRDVIITLHTKKKLNGLQSSYQFQNDGHFMRKGRALFGSNKNLPNIRECER